MKGATREGAEMLMLQEWHHFFDNTRRWRNLRKITVAQVHGEVYAAALMLMWACDLIVAAEGTRFADVVGTRLGMCGVEYFAHPWEFGPRKTKELMLTGDSLTVEDAYQMGMVSKIFPESELNDKTLEFVRRIAKVSTMAALLAKEAVNQTGDNMGFYNALNACFTLHQLNHAHWAWVHDSKWPVGLEEDGLPNCRTAPPVTPAAKDKVGPDAQRPNGLPLGWRPVVWAAQSECMFGDHVAEHLQRAAAKRNGDDRRRERGCVVHGHLDSVGWLGAPASL